MVAQLDTAIVSTQAYAYAVAVVKLNKLHTPYWHWRVQVKRITTSPRAVYYMSKLANINEYTDTTYIHW